MPTTGPKGRQRLRQKLDSHIGDVSIIVFACCTNPSLAMHWILCLRLSGKFGDSLCASISEEQKCSIVSANHYVKKTIIGNVGNG